MKASELIEKLRELIKRHGDHEVYYSSDIEEFGRGYIVDSAEFKKHILHPDYLEETVNGGDVCGEGYFLTT